MKKLLLKLLTITFAFTLCLGVFSACDEQHSHDYKTLKYDTTRHWYECECGEKSTIVTHALVNDTCVCGYVKPEEHIHDYNRFKHDNTNHWKECECGDKYYLAEHEFIDGECGCGYVGGPSYFFIATTNSGKDSDGIYELARRFEEKFKDYSFAEGKKGVIVDIEAKGLVDVTSMAQEVYHAYINPYSVSNTMIGSGEFLNVDEFYKITIPGEDKTIEDKIPENYRPKLQGTSAKWGSGYYFAPGVSYLGGISYDKYLFDTEGYYFTSPIADAGETTLFWSDTLQKEFKMAFNVSEDYETAIDSPRDWSTWNSNKYLSCGPDGVYGTYDDGMPSSLEELIVLCERINDDGIYPFCVSGRYPKNHFYSEEGLINSLLGPKNMYTMKTFESEAFEIVTGYQDNTELWGMSGEPVPKTATVEINEYSGYYTTWSTARYYSTAFWKLAAKNKWHYNSDSSEGAIAAQADFISSGYDKNDPNVAMMIETSCWINESQERLNFLNFEKRKFKDSDKNVVSGKDREGQIFWMSLPRQIHGTVAEGQGTVETFMYLDGGSNNVFNARCANDPEALEMIKQWLLLFYSDESLQFLTASTGCPILIDYDKDLDSSNYDSEPFYKDLFKRMENGVAISSNDAPSGGLYDKYPDIFSDHGWGSCWTGLGSDRGLDLHTAFVQGRYTVPKAFEERMITYYDWGPLSAIDQNSIPPKIGKDIYTGVDVVYTKFV